MERGVYVGVEEVLYESVGRNGCAASWCTACLYGRKDWQAFGTPTLAKPEARTRGLASSMITGDIVTGQKNAGYQPVEFMFGG